jgi:NAD(P)-dependent dehydrogenase (short-subunit alcohol dehydrogenase family)
MMIDLAGKRVLVTGGSRGIGLAAVQHLARAGADVTYTARTAAGAQAAGAVARGMVADVTDRAAMEGLMTRGFDAVVNNAGIVTPIGRIDAVAIDDWAQNIAVNLVAAFHVVQCAIKGMPKGGTIVNLSSGAAHRPMEGWSAYCAGKAGLAMVTRSVHEEFGDRGIRIFGFAPGIVDTDMQGTIRASGINPVSKIPREDLAAPDDAAHAIAWLCTAAADMFAGQEVDVRNADFRRAAGLPVTP